MTCVTGSRGKEHKNLSPLFKEFMFVLDWEQEGAIHGCLKFKQEDISDATQAGLVLLPCMQFCQV